MPRKKNSSQSDDLVTTTEQDSTNVVDSVVDIDEAEETLTYKYTITSYGADYLVDGLVKRLNTKDIVVPTFAHKVEDLSGEIEGFQRQFMWTKTQCDRFVESLLLGLPVPGIFLVKQSNGLLLVLDGQQRLKTLQAFYKGVYRRREFRLENVQEQFKNLTYDGLDKEDRRRLDDSVIHATIIRQDEPSDNQDSIYLIFERLNTGGTTLLPQEIRSALYRGPFTELIRELNDHPSWRKLYGKPSDRLKDQELILRFFAFYYNSSTYERPMKGFLNHFIEKRRELSSGDRHSYASLFKRSTNEIVESIGETAFRIKRYLNAAVLDSVMFGVAKRLDLGPIEEHSAVKQSYEKLIANRDYLRTVSRATADEEGVKTRLELARNAFAGVK